MSCRVTITLKPNMQVLCEIIHADKEFRFIDTKLTSAMRRMESYLTGMQIKDKTVDVIDERNSKLN